MSSTTLFNAVFVKPEQVVRFLLCNSDGTTNSKKVAFHNVVNVKYIESAGIGRWVHVQLQS